MFIASVPLNNGSLREERHVEYACTLRSYGARVANCRKAIDMLLLRSKER